MQLVEDEASLGRSGYMREWVCDGIPAGLSHYGMEFVQDKVSMVREELRMGWKDEAKKGRSL